MEHPRDRILARLERRIALEAAVLASQLARTPVEDGRAAGWAMAIARDALHELNWVLEEVRDGLGQDTCG